MTRRYSRQALYSKIGEDGQAAIQRARVLVLGLGALGAASADILARAGVGRLRIVDRDVLELSNLQRQVLYSEADLQSGLPKAEAARQRLSAVNSDIDIEAQVKDVSADNISELLRGCDVVVDGTDNFPTRLLLNDACLEQKTPWIYCGVIGSSIHSFPILPGDGPCFRCYIGEAPSPGSVDTCDTAGVLGPAVLMAVSLSTTAALKIITGQREALLRGLQMMDLWSGQFRRFGLKSDPDCRACQGHYDYLRGQKAETVARLCGRNAVQLSSSSQGIDLKALGQRLQPQGQVSANAFLLRYQPREWPQGEITVFPDGRLIVKGTNDVSQARSVASRYLGL